MRHVARQYELKLADPVSEASPKKPRYSYSAIEKAKCGERYRLSKLHDKRELTYNLAAGTLLDTAFNAYYENNQHLVQSHEERVEYARAAVELHLQEHPEYMELAWSKKAGDPRSSVENYLCWLFDHGALELVCRHDRGPVEVQKKVEIELPNYFIVGYIDCLEINSNTIVDIKAVTGWGATTSLGYALRSQVPLYRMLLADSTGQATSGRYELLLCRKKPTLTVVEDRDIDYLQEKLVEDFDKHHRMLTSKVFKKNPEHCLDFNKPCQFLNLCWPELAAEVNNTQPEN